MGTKFLKHFNAPDAAVRADPGLGPGAELGRRVRLRGRRLGAARAVPDPRLRGRVVLRDRAGADGREREGGRALPGGRRRRGRSARSSRSATRAGRRRTSRPCWRWRSPRAWATRPPPARRCRRSAAPARTCSPSPRPCRACAAGAAALRKGIAAWYEGKAPEALAYQVAKYQRRNGWSHRDLLRLAHPATADPARQAVYRWVVGGAEALGPREVKRGEAVALVPRGRRAPAAPARRDGRGPDGRPRGRHPADPRGRPAARVHPDGAPERPGGLGGAAGGHAADGDGAQPRQDDGRRPADARLEGDEGGPRAAGGWRATSASRGCTRWRSCSPRPRTPAAAA